MANVGGGVALNCKRLIPIHIRQRAPPVDYELPPPTLEEIENYWSNIKIYDARIPTESFDHFRP